MPRVLVTTLVVAVSVISWAAPASAHAKFPGAVPYASGTDQRLTLQVPEERGDKTHTAGITVFIPAGWRATACDAAAPWRCTVPAGTAERGDVVEWVLDSGAAPGPDDETFVFSVHTGPPGKVSFPVHQTYASGEVVRWIGPAGGEEPAPRLEAVGGAAPSATTTSGPQATTTTGSPAPATTVAAPPPEPAGSGKSNPAVFVVPVLLAAAIAGGLLRWRAGKT